ncbi:hypothetical protein WG922_20525 [Ramlibacter sp. AN1015]|uniref:hypothetical protein n=1 Tax=Ramlibacter sp. AN1015 TaxID=3133428 RepID=UPI0030C53531
MKHHPTQHARTSSPWTDFLGGTRQGFLLAAAAVVLALPPGNQSAAIASTPTSAWSMQQARQAATASMGAPPAAEPAPRELIRLAQFGDSPATPEARHVANWALHSGDHQNRSVVVVDKKDARVFVFDKDGRLLGATPALLGSAIGDHTVPGVGDKPIAQVLPEERTTPAGRFIAEPGMNANGEDVVWVDYDAAVSMHRVRATVKSERRLQRLASPTPADNRISYGCINLPKAFYEDILRPAVQSAGAVIYVLPETASPPEVFGSYEVPHADILALFANPSR